MASAAYLEFQRQVKANSGRITVAPSGRASAAYDAAIWVPKANTKQWPLPNEYSGNGRTGYYHVPAHIAEEIAKFGTATPEETKAGANQLMDQWGIPPALRSLGNFGETLKSILVMGLIVAAVYAVTKSQGIRNWT